MAVGEHGESVEEFVNMNIFISGLGMHVMQLTDHWQAAGRPKYRLYRMLR